MDSVLARVSAISVANSMHVDDEWSLSATKFHGQIRVFAKRGDLPAMCYRSEELATLGQAYQEHIRKIVDAANISDQMLARITDAHRAFYRQLAVAELHSRLNAVLCMCGGRLDTIKDAIDAWGREHGLAHNQS